MNQHYDAIVVGSGLGGLTAGALWAKQGKRVLVLERHDKPGGAATVYRRKRLDIEVSLEQIDGFDTGDQKRHLWQALDLDRYLQRLPLKEFYSVRFADGSKVHVPHNTEQAQQALSASFPSNQQKVANYFKELIGIRKAVDYLNLDHKSLFWWLSNGFKIPYFVFQILKRNNKTVADLMQTHFDDKEKIKISLAANIGFYSNNIEAFSAIYFALAQGSYHCGGGYYLAGGSQALSDALVAQIEAANGRVVTKRTVSKVLIRNGKVIGVEHQNNLTIGKRRDPKEIDIEQAHSEVVFFNAAPSLLPGMLPKIEAKLIHQRYRTKPLSTSLWTLSLGMDTPPEQLGIDANTTFIIPKHCKTFSAYASSQNDFSETPNNDNMPPYSITDHNRLDSGLNKAGRYLLTLVGVDAINHWEALSEEAYYAHKKAWSDALIDDLERHYPGIKATIVFEDMATARTMREYLNTPEGAVYGFEQTAPFFKKGPPSSKTPIKGLFLASAFGAFGGGFTGAMLSGEKAAMEALG
jgi:phytoene dehydrogenase-like protein